MATAWKKQRVDLSQSDLDKLSRIASANALGGRSAACAFSIRWLALNLASVPISEDAVRADAGRNLSGDLIAWGFICHPSVRRDIVAIRRHYRLRHISSTVRWAIGVQAVLIDS